MDRTALLTLKAVAEARGVTRAAERLPCVPSAVTARLKRLEAEVGRALFLRERRGMVPTEHGRTLLGYAERALALLEEAGRGCARTPSPPAGCASVPPTPPRRSTRRPCSRAFTRPTGRWRWRSFARSARR